MYDYSILEDFGCIECGEEGISNWKILGTYASGTEIKCKECGRTIQVDFPEV